MTVPELYAHQEYTANFSLDRKHVFDLSDPGTGKTRAYLEGYVRRFTDESSTTKRLLVVCPLSIVEPSWGNDIRQFTDLTFACALGVQKNRYKAFDSSANVVLINTDGVKWIADNPAVLDDFTDLCIDEFIAFKNKDAQRSKAMRRVAMAMNHITALSGTAISNSLTDLWHPALIVDGGDRLGKNFFRYRESVCYPQQVGYNSPHVKWVDKQGMAASVSVALQDITVRHLLEECIDIPEHFVIDYPVVMPARVMKAYKEMEQTSALELEDGIVSAIHAGVRAKKLLQIISGTVYDQQGVVHTVHNDRYGLVGELVEERQAVIVAFTWGHERDGLLREMSRRNLPTAVIDGKVSVGLRNKAVKDFQDGKLRCLLCHPAAAAHGLTLTHGSTTIWCSATYSAEFYKQMNRRIYRAGQTKKTETIRIYAEGTKEIDVYEALDGKIEGMEGLLKLMVTKDG